jgi:acyl-CoA synthetase (AMP-forming)/AMP-acid ligase II
MAQKWCPYTWAGCIGSLPRGTAEEIIAFCREHLARFKAPRTVLFGQLPKTSTGKIQKFVLRERAKENI